MIMGLFRDSWAFLCNVIENIRAVVRGITDFLVSILPSGFGLLFPLLGVGSVVLHYVLAYVNNRLVELPSVQSMMQAAQGGVSSASSSLAGFLGTLGANLPAMLYCFNVVAFVEAITLVLFVRGSILLYRFLKSWIPTVSG